MKSCACPCVRRDSTTKGTSADSQPDFDRAAVLPCVARVASCARSAGNPHESGAAVTGYGRRHRSADCRVIGLGDLRVRHLSGVGLLQHLRTTVGVRSRRTSRRCERIARTFTKLLKPLLSWTWLGLIGTSVVLSQNFPLKHLAPWTFLPVAGATLVIAAGTGGEPQSQGFLRTCASTYIDNLSDSSTWCTGRRLCSSDRCWRYTTSFETHCARPIPARFAKPVARSGRAFTPLSVQARSGWWPPSCC